jgi:hypothetical protein
MTASNERIPDNHYAIPDPKVLQAFIRTPETTKVYTLTAKSQPMD